MSLPALRMLLRRCKITLQARSSATLKVNVGAGVSSIRGWINLDKDLLDITIQHDWARIFAPRSINRLLAEHVLEHLEDSEVRHFLNNANEFLAPGGRIRIAVPDGLHPDKDYIDQVKPGGYGDGADDHKQLFNYRSLTGHLESAGYQVQLLEWFDESGTFNKCDWFEEDGPVLRSAANDPRNVDQPLCYTSLIIDGKLK